MKNGLLATPRTRLTLEAGKAADLMTDNPVSVRADATLGEAVALLARKGFSGAPVIDGAGRPVGVLSQSDIVVHDREAVGPRALPEYYGRVDLDGPGAARSEATPPDDVRVADLMTPVVFSVTPDTSAAEVVRELLALKVHRLFVVDGAGVLVGVISAHDVLRRLGA